jgi:uncharacterized membrane protein
MLNTPLLAVLQWHPRFGGIWCGVLILLLAVWVYFLYRRLRRRVPVARARWLMIPKLLVLFLLLLLLFDPVSAVQKTESANGKLLVLTDTSSSMDVADDYHQSRVARARQIVESWKAKLPRGLKLDELEFDTTVHKPGDVSRSVTRGTDLGGCLLALSERNDMVSYLGVVLLTDGGDEALDNPVLPKTPLCIVGIGTDPATWNDVEITGAECPTTAEKDVDFEVSADIQAHAGHSQDFARKLGQVRVLLEHGTGTNAWEKVAEQIVDLSNLRARVRLPVKCAELGVQRYRVTAEPVAGELSLLNNSRVVLVNVEKKSVHVLYFAQELGQEFKVLRNELAHDPGISFTALYRTTGDRFMLQGDRLPGDDALANGFPSTKKGLEPYDAVIIGSLPAAECSPQQMQALIHFVEDGGTLIFLGGDSSFGRGGYAQTPLAALFPWRLSDREPEPAHGSFAVRVPPMGMGNPILATVEDIIARNGAALDSVNVVEELKPGATALLGARAGEHDLAVAAFQPFGKGKVMAIASNTLWKWATQPEPLRSAYGLFWRQAVRNLTGKTEGGQNLTVRWDKDFYRPGELARGEIRIVNAGIAPPRFTASLSAQNLNAPVTVEPLPEQPQAFQVRFRFRDRGEYGFRLVAYQGDRVLETYEKSFSVAPMVAEGSRLELDEVFLRKLAEQGGGAYFRESEARQCLEHFAVKGSRKVTVEESSLVETGPWFLLAFLGILVFEWILRRKMNLF